MKARDGALWVCVVSAAVSLATLAGGCGSQDDRPNVMLIIVDTLRPDYLGCYGAGFARTPSVDGLAGGGARFTCCVTTAPVTLPSVSSILTSSYPVHHGVRDNGIFKLDPSLESLTEVFRENGYATGAVVGAYVLAEESGIDQGFGFFDSDFSGTYREQSSLLTERAEEVSKTQRRAAEVTERAVRWLQGTDRPFFLMAHYFDPHGPYDPPPSYIEKNPRNKYLGEVEYTDDNLAPLFRAAETAAGESELITIFMADHGEGLGRHGEDTHGFFIYDSTVLVPLILHYPGHIPPGTLIEEQVSTVDVAPTILDLAGLTPPPDWQGISHAWRLIAKPVEERPETTLPDEQPGPCYIETYRTKYSYNWSELVGVRHAGWKLIRAPRAELYDLAEDPAEESNLYELRPHAAARLESVLDSLILVNQGPLAERGPIQDLDQEMVGKLEALGYVMPSTEPPPGPLPDPKDKISGLNRRLESKEVVKKARVLFNEGDPGGAEAELKRALELDENNAVAVHDLGAIYYGRGELEKALRYFEEAVRLSPSSPVPREHLGGVYLDLDRNEEAAAALEAAVALDPEKADTRLGYGLALQRTGDERGALEQYKKAIELDPELSMAYYRAAYVLVGLGRHDEAARDLKEMLTRQPPPGLAERAREFLAEIDARTSSR